MHLAARSRARTWSGAHTIAVLVVASAGCAEISGLSELGLGEPDGSSVAGGGGAPTGGGSGAADLRTLVVGPAGAHGIAVDDVSVYFTSYEGTSVLRAPIGGGTPEVLAADQDEPSMLALRSGQLYWTARQDGAVRRVPIGGGPWTVVASGANLFGLAADAERIYWSSLDGPVSSISPGEAVALHSEVAGNSVNLAVDGESIYWTSGNEDEVRRVALAGGETTTVAATGDAPWGIAVDDDAVYWTSKRAGTVSRRAKVGGDVVTLAEAQDSPNCVVVDEVHAYWVNFGDGRVMRCPREGGPAEAIASGQESPLCLTLHGDRVYWTNFGDGTVMSALK